MLRNARAFHTFFLGVSQVPEPRKVWCHKLSVSHSSWLCTAFFYSTALNDSNCTTFNSGLEQGLIKKQDSNRAAFYDGLERRTILCLHDYYTLLSLFIHLASLVISQKKRHRDVPHLLLICSARWSRRPLNTSVCYSSRTR